LIINAVKYAFPEPRVPARIRVTFEMAESDWKLTVADNGVGRAEKQDMNTASGLGTALIGACQAAQGPGQRGFVKRRPQHSGDALDVSLASAGGGVTLAASAFPPLAAGFSTVGRRSTVSV
jgi:LytS/YehU family sensor histidine kinase